ncbi:MAG: amidohydrolase, partial [Bacillota bacterium]|nr:amidohydrolase [Bacillota bacterium]
SMGGEDFAYYCEQVPGAFFQLGVGTANEAGYPLHHPKFQVNEEGIATGIKVMAMIVIEAMLDFVNKEGVQK